jgi:hypothetical protein
VGYSLIPEHVAIVGSRQGADLSAVDEFVWALYQKHPDTVLVSGGAPGVDSAAEQLWLRLGGDVVSIRPRKVNDECYAIEVWELGSNPRIYDPVGEPTFHDYRSVALYRNSLIAEKADRVVAFFRRGRSHGTWVTLDFATAYGKPIYEFEAAA